MTTARMAAGTACLGIGHAITDMVYRVGGDFLLREGLSSGSMTLVDGEEALRLRGLVEGLGCVGEVSAGGAAANTFGHLARLGVGAEILVRVGDDVTGARFCAELRGLGVEVLGGFLAGGVSGQCLVFVTEGLDGFVERTMATCLGVSPRLSLGGVEDLGWGGAGWLYLEGYLWDSEDGRRVAEKAARMAVDLGVLVALSLSDSLCVMRHGDSFRDLISSCKALVFGNAREGAALTGEETFTGTVAALRGLGCEFVLTRGAEGSVVSDGVDIWQIGAVEVGGVGEVVDVTGAGDLYASGYLCGRVLGLSVAESGAMGARAARETLGHLGARSGADFAERVRL